jgi:hypothetical protein
MQVETNRARLHRMASARYSRERRSAGGRLAVHFDDYFGECIDTAASWGISLKAADGDPNLIRAVDAAWDYANQEFLQ